MDHPVIIDSEGRINSRARNISLNLQQAILKAKQDIMAQEDAAIFETLDSIFEIKYSNNKE